MLGDFYDKHVTRFPARYVLGRGTQGVAQNFERSIAGLPAAEVPFVRVIEQDLKKLVADFGFEMKHL